MATHCAVQPRTSDQLIGQSCRLQKGRTTTGEECAQYSMVQGYDEASGTILRTAVRALLQKATRNPNHPYEKLT